MWKLKQGANYHTSALGQVYSDSNRAGSLTPKIIYYCTQVIKE